MFVGLLVAGVYALASNFKQEKKRGTLNFLRLSPQKARSIIVGKLLGVPVLVYLGVLCAVPLQMYAAHSAQIARANVLAWDLAMLGLGIFFYLDRWECLRHSCTRLGGGMKAEQVDDGSRTA
jgi:ABC-type transport system involved in cytochrome c biogenesis permease component